jgi:hypothetical protein
MLIVIILTTITIAITIILTATTIVVRDHACS